VSPVEVYVIKLLVYEAEVSVTVLNTVPLLSRRSYFTLLTVLPLTKVVGVEGITDTVLLLKVINVPEAIVPRLCVLLTEKLSLLFKLELT
jgi:hypothetical protein